MGHVLKREHLTQRELSERTGILPQRINDYILGRRRLSAEISLKLEKALSIDVDGFFYLIQCNHDIYVALTDKIESEKPDLTKIRRNIFWDTSIENMDWEGNRQSIIQRVFEYGDEIAIMEIIRYYGKDVVNECLEGISDSRLMARRIKNINLYLK